MTQIPFEQEGETSSCLLILKNAGIPWVLPAKQDFDVQNIENIKKWQKNHLEGLAKSPIS